MYMRALEYFTTYLKYEKNPTLKTQVTQKVEEYMTRAEKLKVYLDSQAASSSSSSSSSTSMASTSSTSETVEKGDVPTADDLGGGMGRRRTREELQEYLEGKSLEEVLHRRVIGQDVAVSGVSRAIMRSYEGWRMGESPLVFLLLGPSGVGKTELAKAVAEALLGDASAILRLDLSEFQEAHSVSKILGAPQGYVGSSETPYFVDQLRKNPSTVVLLDECEKAHDAVLTMWLGVFDDGRFTPSTGGTIYCSDAIFILTSNAGSELISELAGSTPRPDLDTYTTALEPVLKKQFKRDEFLGRLDEILPFEPFTEDHLGQVISHFLQKWVDLASIRHSITLSFSDAVIASIIAQYNPRYGVRSVKHIIEREVGNVLADASSRNILYPGVVAQVDVGGGGDFVVVPVVDGDRDRVEGGRVGGAVLDPLEWN